MPLSESELAYRERKRRRQAGWSRFRYMPCLPSGTDGRRLTACEDHLQLSRRAAASGDSPGSMCPPGNSQVVRAFCRQRTHFASFFASTNENSGETPCGRRG